MLKARQQEVVLKAAARRAEWRAHRRLEAARRAAARAVRRPHRPFEAQKLADGLFRITGGDAASPPNGHHIVVLEGGQNEARGLAVISAAKAADSRQTDPIRGEHPRPLRFIRERPGAVCRRQVRRS